MRGDLKPKEREYDPYMRQPPSAPVERVIDTKTPLFKELDLQPPRFGEGKFPTKDYDPTVKPSGEIK
jgi:hypothetical protein